MENLAKCYQREVLKKECWDSMQVKGKAIKVSGLKKKKKEVDFIWGKNFVTIYTSIDFTWLTCNYRNTIQLPSVSVFVCSSLPPGLSFRK